MLQNSLAVIGLSWIKREVALKLHWQTRWILGSIGRRNDVEFLWIPVVQYFVPTVPLLAVNPCNVDAQLVTSQPDAADITMTFTWYTDVLGQVRISWKQHVSSTVHRAHLHVLPRFLVLQPLRDENYEAKEEARSQYTSMVVMKTSSWFSAQWFLRISSVSNGAIAELLSAWQHIITSVFSLSYSCTFASLSSAHVTVLSCALDHPTNTFVLVSRRVAEKEMWHRTHLNRTISISHLCDEVPKDTWAPEKPAASDLLEKTTPIRLQRSINNDGPSSPWF